MKRGEEARLAEECKADREFEKDYQEFKTVGENLNTAWDISESELRTGFGAMNHRLGVLNEQFLNVLWGAF